METKMNEVNLKNQEVYSGDGLDNHEHILDMQNQIKVLIENIQENTDSAFKFLKMHENDDNQEFVDVIRVNCSNILDCEKLANNFAKQFSQIVDKLKENSIEIDKYLSGLEELFEKIQHLESSSEYEYSALIKKINSDF